MASHVRVGDLFKVGCHSKALMLKTVFKQTEMHGDGILYDRIYVQSQRYGSSLRSFNADAGVGLRLCAFSERKLSNPTLLDTICGYHNYNCKHQDGKGTDCCHSDESHSDETSTKPGQECWKCGRRVDDDKERYFCICGVVQPPVVRRSLFEVMGVKETFDVDLQELTEKYRGLQRILHPDKYSQKSETEKEFSAQHSTLVNRAYNTLQRPLARGLYMLHLNEDNLEHETHLSTAEFLDEIMSINEALIEADSAEEIKAVGDHNQSKIDDLERRVSAAFKKGNTDAAKELLLRLKYYANIQDKVKESLQKII